VGSLAFLGLSAGLVDSKLECLHLAECIRTRRQPLADGRNGAQVVEVIEAAHRSLQAGGAKVPNVGSAGAVAVNPNNGDRTCAGRTNGSPIDVAVTGGNGDLRAAGLPWS
jgi:hypothetical protein